MTPYVLLALAVAGGLLLMAVLRFSTRQTRDQFYVCAILVSGALAVASWYTDWPMALQRWASLALYAGTGTYAAWWLHAGRPPEGWRNGEHERIEQT